MRRTIAAVLAAACLVSCDQSSVRKTTEKLEAFDVQEPDPAPAPAAAGAQIAYSYTVSYVFDRPTVAQVQESRRGWKLGRSIFVGDAGMDAEANRQALSPGKLADGQEEGLGRAGRFRPVRAALTRRRWLRSSPIWRPGSMPRRRAI